jgi:hypothetical protein
MSVEYRNFIYNKEKRVVFAYVPKVACSNWKSIMRHLAGFSNYLDTKYAHDRVLSGLSYLDQEPNPEHILNDPDTKIVACVREPYSRVLSAYLNKVEQRLELLGKPEEKDHFDVVVNNIEEFRIKRLNVNKYPEITFNVFLRWLKESNIHFTNDEHWRLQSKLLNINSVKFDLLGRFESLATDATEILAFIGSPLSFPSQKDIKFKPTGAINKVQKYYDDECYALVNDIYADDFTHFGYPVKNVKTEKDVVENKFPEISIVSVHNQQAKKIHFPAGEHIINAPIELDSFDVLSGEGRGNTFLKVVGTFAGPFIKSARLADNCQHGHWLFEEGVPVRFVIKNITIDLSDWEPSQTSYAFKYGEVSQAAVGLYGKAFEIESVTVVNCPGDGVISIGSARGGKKDFYLDSPEAIINNLEVINTKGSGVIFAGPHDSFLKQIIVSHCKKKGVFVVADSKFSGACDIDFIHAYATDNIAIDINAKVKARFLQGDTGKKAGVVLSGSNKTVVNTIEVFKTRGIDTDYSVKLDCSEAQIGTVRIRADAGASGLSMNGFGNSIDNLHIEAEGIHSDFSHLNIMHQAQPIAVGGNQNSIYNGRIITSNLEPIICNNEVAVRRFKGSLTVFSKTNYGLSYNLAPKNFELSNIKIENY